MKNFAGLFTILLCAAGFVLGEGLPKIAVYVTGDLNKSEGRALGTEMLSALVKSGRYIAVERAEAFVAAIEREHVTQRSGAVDDNEIRELGKQFGVSFICVADVAEIFDAHQMSARIINVETAEVIAIGKAGGTLNSVGAMMVIANAVVNNMFDDLVTAEIEDVEAEEEIQPEEPLEVTLEEPILPVDPVESAKVAEPIITAQSIGPADPDVMVAKFTAIDFERGGFTMEQRKRAMRWNVLGLPLGTLFIQRDYVGSVISGGLGGAGWYVVVTGFVDMLDAMKREKDAVNRYNNYVGRNLTIWEWSEATKAQSEAMKAQKDIKASYQKYYLGMCLTTTGIIYTKVRARSYTTSASKAANANASVKRVGFAALPDDNGNINVYASYNMEF